MRLFRRAFTFTLANKELFSNIHTGTLSRGIPVKVSMTMMSKNYSQISITENIKLLNLYPIRLESQSQRLPKVILEDSSSRPLVILLEWMNAKEKHVEKFQDFYEKYDLDILRVKLNPWQLMWPAKGSQLIAKNIADFLLENPCYSTLLVHGFSVGGYLWGEVLVTLSKEREKYESVTNRIIGQICDSAVDVEEIPPGFPAALFPKNPFLRSTFEKYIRYHMKVFYEDSTKHYIASRAAFTSGIVRAPYLFIYSDNDPVSTPYRNEMARQELVNLNIEAYLKFFRGSRHVSHFHQYRDEYIAELETFLDKVGLISSKVLQAKL